MLHSPKDTSLSQCSSCIHGTHWCLRLCFWDDLKGSHFLTSRWSITLSIQERLINWCFYISCNIQGNVSVLGRWSHQDNPFLCTPIGGRVLGLTLETFLYYPLKGAKCDMYAGSSERAPCNTASVLQGPPADCPVIMHKYTLSLYVFYEGKG